MKKEGMQKASGDAFTAEGPGQRREPQSSIRGVTLASFLQLMKLEQKTCTLSLRAGPDQGRIFMDNGEVVNAETGSPGAPTGSGHNAFRRIMAWDMPAIELTEGGQAVPREIHLPLMHLLMESQQQIDESVALKKSHPPKPAGTLDAVKLGAMLGASNAVTAYEVTGPDGDAARQTNGGLDIAPARLMALGDRLGFFLNSRFKSLKINLDDNSSYWAGKIKGLDVRVKLKPGFRPGKWMD